MPSITYWNRLEPRPRARDLAPSLAARVRDPLWFLARQFQMAEFRGEDAASPAYVRFSIRRTPVTGWRVNGGPVQPIDGSTPVETLLESEAQTERLGVAVELGQIAEAIFVERGLDALLDTLRRAYSILPATEAGLALIPDPAEASFLRVVGGRATDGVTLFVEAAAAAPNVPARLTVPPTEIPPGDRLVAAAALADFVADARVIYGQLGTTDAPTWNPERLEYRVQALAQNADGALTILRADPGDDGDFDWPAFDVESVEQPAPQAEAEPVETIAFSVLPTHVRFPGMPNHRWWDFESATTDFGAVDADRRDLARLLVMDFALVAGNDWFMAPLPLAVGSLAQIDALIVHDVFGGATLVPRADALDGEGLPWSMFSIAAPTGVAPFFLLPPHAGAAVQPGPFLEEVRFFRDEMADMVWAIEHVLEGATSEALQGQERSQALAAIETPAAGSASAASLRYVLETEVPANWIPWLPVALDAVSGQVALERAAVIRALPDGTLVAVDPQGRILAPPHVSPYRVREEEVSRAGLRIMRVPYRSRWVDGSTHVWIGRRKTAGGGEGWSGLIYDLATGK